MRETKQGNENIIEGRQAVREALRAGVHFDRLLLQEGPKGGVLSALKKTALAAGVPVREMPGERLRQLSPTGRHQGVLAYVAAAAYAEVADILARAAERNEKPFIFLLDSIEDPHNLGAIIRTANVAGAHGVIIPKHRAVSLTAAVQRASAGALSHTPVARVTNLSDCIASLKKEGLWFVCADMGGEPMYGFDLRGPIGLVIGNEGAGVGERVKKSCDMIASIPVRGEIASLNASVAAGVLAYEVVRQRMTGERP